MKIQDLLFTENCVLPVSRIEVLEEEEREITTSIVAVDNGFMTQQNAGTFLSLICRDSR